VYYILSMVDKRVYLEADLLATVTAFEDFAGAYTWMLRRQQDFIRMGATSADVHMSIVEVSEEDLAPLVPDPFFLQRIELPRGMFTAIELSEYPEIAEGLWRSGHNPEYPTP
jgi:hypothetical protein